MACFFARLVVVSSIGFDIPRPVLFRMIIVATVIYLLQKVPDFLSTLLWYSSAVLILAAVIAAALHIFLHLAAVAIFRKYWDGEAKEGNGAP